MSQATISNPQTFQDDASMLGETALFNPVPTVRDNALKQLRAQSPYSADQWEALDESVFARDEEGELTAASTLQIDNWMDYSGDVIADQDVPSTVVDSLIGMGMSASTNLARYIYVSQARDVDFEADVSMNGRSRARQDMPAWMLDGVPLPIVHADYEIDSREFQNAQAFGEGFDTSMGSEARRAVGRGEADLLWNGWDRSIQTDRGPFSVDGLDSDIPQIIGGTSGGWATDPNNVLSDISDMHDLLEQQGPNNNNGPMPSELGAILFVPIQQWGTLSRADYTSSAADVPIIERVNTKYPYLSLQPAPQLSAGSIIMLVRDTRYFQVVIAQGLTNTNWTVDGGFGRRNKVLSSRVPYIKTQPDGINGIVRFTGAGN